MAQNKKDNEEENINAESQGDINEADDNFGLPDLDYQPIDELDESTQEVTENIEETVSETTEDLEDIYATTADESETEDFDFSEPDSTEDDYVPGSYTPPHSSSNTGIKVFIILIVLLLFGGIAWYMFSYRPKQQAEQARVEQQRKEETERQRLAAEQKAQEERLAAEREAQLLAEQQAQEEAVSEIGTIETISTRTSRYYVVVASAIDGDLAMDYAKEASKNGVSIKIIEPYGKTKFHRVSVEDHDTYAEAQNRADNLKTEYGDGVWVIKY